VLSLLFVSKESLGPISQALESEPIEVPYLVLSVSESNPSENLQKIANMINVQVKLNGEEIPFVPFNRYESLTNKKKIFLYGRSGCGKSRSILELVRKNLGTCDKIYIINPRNTTSENSKIANLRSLVATFTPNDLVIWDNFPDQLIKRDFATALKALEIVSSRETNRTIISLKPDYLEPYRSIEGYVPELHSVELSYNKEKIKDLLKLQGNGMNQFKSFYRNYIENDLDDVAEKLWGKEPFPITVLDFYAELHKRAEQPRQLNAIRLADELSKFTEYYENQFKFINEHRKNDAHFLFTIKICYELDLPRSAEYVTDLQRKIFGTEPPSDPFPRLSTWTYLSGRFYFMHDGVRDAIKLDEFIKLSVIPFITKNIKAVARNENEHKYRLGRFVGENIMHIIDENSMQAFKIAEQKKELDLRAMLLPKEIYDYMKEGSFEWGFGYGCGEVFASLDRELQEAILKIARPRKLLGEGLAQSFGNRYHSLNKTERAQVKVMTYSGLPFARYFGESVGPIFKKLDTALQSELLSLIKENDQVADGLGMGIGSIFGSLEDPIKAEISCIAEKNSTLTRGLGLGFGRTFVTLDKESRTKMINDVKTNNELAFGFGMGLADTYSKTFGLMTDQIKNTVLDLVRSDAQIAQGFGCYINQLWFSGNESQLQEQKKIVELAGKNSHLAFGFGVGIAYIIQDYISQNEQAIFFGMTYTNSEYARGFGHGIGIALNLLPDDLKNQQYMMASTNAQYEAGLGSGSGTIAIYLTEDFRNELLEKAETSTSFAFGHGYGLGYVFSYLKPSVRHKILTTAEQNPELARGLGYGFGTVFRYLQDDIRKQILCMVETNVLFARGFGQGCGVTYAYLSKETRENLLALADVNSEFASGLGDYLGRNCQYLSDEIKNEIFENAERNPRFAVGLGTGLGYVFPYLSEDTRREIFNRSQRSAQLNIGLGIGLGNAFSYLKEDLQKKILSKSKDDSRFAASFASSVGQIFASLSTEQQESIFAEAIDQNSPFAKGLAEGLSKSFKYLKETPQYNILRRIDHNSQFAKRFAMGLGSNFLSLDQKSSLLNQTLQEKILEMAETEIRSEFAKGLAEGLSGILAYLDEKWKKRIREFAARNPQFAKMFQ
jgi:hypothetical protein